MPRFTIGRLAKAAGVGVETIRFYEKRGLISRPQTTGTYREYPLETIERIHFIKRAQELGFTLAEIVELLSLANSPHTDRQAAKQFATQKVEDIRARIADLQRMLGTLSHLVEECSGHGPMEGCPIIEALANHTSRTHSRES